MAAVQANTSGFERMNESLGEGATVIDLKVSGTFGKSQSPSRASCQSDDVIDHTAAVADDDGLNQYGFSIGHKRGQSASLLPIEELSDKNGFLLRKQLMMKKKLELIKKQRQMALKSVKKLSTKVSDDRRVVIPRTTTNLTFNFQPCE